MRGEESGEGAVGKVSGTWGKKEKEEMDIFLDVKTKGSSSIYLSLGRGYRYQALLKYSDGFGGAVEGDLLVSMHVRGIQCLKSW